jgi:hypothetical protein
VEHRYADDSEPSWYTGRRYATEPDSPEVSGSFRLPEQREAAAPEPESRAGYESVRIPVRGPEYPAVRPAPVPPPAESAAPTGLMPPVPSRPPDGVYRTRRPISSVILAVAVGILLLPVLRLLASVTFAAQATARGIVPAVLLTLGLALTGFGLFAAGGGAVSRESWLRAPMAYLPAGLILLLAAGLAVA